LRPKSRVIAAAFAGRAPRVVTVSASGAIDIWNRRTGTLVRSLARSGGGGPVRALFSADGARLAVVRLSSAVDKYSTKSVTLWDTLSGRRLASLRLHTGVIALSADGRSLALAFRPARGTPFAAR